MKGIQELISGFARFRTGYYAEHRAHFDRLAQQGQAPRVAIVTCCDSRIDPSTMFDSAPGDLFVIRNVANLVPPYEQGGGYHGTSAALEFAVKGLGVRHIVVMGHAQCGGVRSLLEDNAEARGYEFLGPWMGIASHARARVLASAAGRPAAERELACEVEVLKTSLANLRTFPWIAERSADGSLWLHGWYYDLAEGDLLALDGERLAPVVAS